MLESYAVDATSADEFEIKAYVIRPPVSRGARYLAPRLARSSFSGLDQRPGGFWHLWSRRPEQLTLQWGQIAESVGELRYGAATPRAAVRSAALSRLLRAVRARQWWCLGVIAAFGLSYVAGRMWPVESPQVAEAPAVVQLSSQNLPAKLALLGRSRASLEQAGRRGVIAYTVVAGDSFSLLGQKFGLRARTVRLCNGLPRGYRLRVGQQLLIPPVDGVMHRVLSPVPAAKLAERYGVSLDLLREHNAPLRASFKAGERVFVPGARDLRYQSEGVEVRRGYREEARGPWARRLSVSRSLVGQFGNRVGALSWPASGQFSSPFGIRGFAFHPGVDICNAVGTGIRAAKGGTVVSAGWMGAYGYAVDIEHSPGVVTRYAHCSRLLVGAGERVSQGQLIAKMGNTGRSTGPHLHFEVRIQGRAVNPSNFL